MRTTLLEMNTPKVSALRARAVKKGLLRLCAGSLLLAGSLATVQASNLQELGKTLTPLGGEKAGNKEGTIPAWSGGGVGEIPKSYALGKHHPDPFADEEPLFVITAENLDQHKDKLTEGQIALFLAYPDTYKMRVYPSHRTAQYPQWYYDNTKACATKAKTTEGGDGIEGAHACLPFPLANSGHQAMWNHQLRFQGLYREVTGDSASPDANGRYVKREFKRHMFFPYYDENRTDSGQLSMLLPRTLSPARTAGDTFLVLDYLNPKAKPRQAWRYFGGQRRVRRAPVFVFDTPIPSSGGLRTMDAYDLWFGSLQKYDWKLVGKRELYIPYNSYRLGAAGVSNEELLQPGHVKADLARYEQHRVWVVEANLKDGERHIYPRRTLYLDEDTWMAVIHDMYDERGQLWRTAHKFSKLYWEVPLVGDVLNVHHDLLSRRYAAIPMMGEYDKPIDFLKEPPGDAFFTPANIRKLGVR